MAVYREEWADFVRKAVDDEPYRKVAARVKVSLAYLSDWVSGKVPSRDMVERFADGMGLPLEDALNAAGYEPVRTSETWEQRLGRGLIELKHEFPDLVVEVPKVTPLTDEPITIEDVEEILADIRVQLEQMRKENQAGN